MQGSPRALSHTGQDDEYALWDAAYVLGSLSASERREYEVHLHGCQSCRESVGQLSGMPAILGKLTADEAAAIDDRGSQVLPALSPRVLPSLLAKVSRRRRNARLATWTVGAAAAAVMVIGVFVGVQSHWGVPASVPPGADASALTMTPVAPTELTAAVTMTGHGWGTEIDMSCTYPAEVATAPSADEPPDKLAMVVVGRDGSHDRLATWLAVKGVRATPAGSTSMPIDQIATVQIVSADTGDVLLQRSL